MENLIKICPACGKKLDKCDVRKKYCNAKCKKIYYKMHLNLYSDQGKPIRRFTCKKCKKTVYVYTSKDKRTQFCNRLCERRWFRHYHKDNQQIQKGKADNNPN